MSFIKNFVMSDEFAIFIPTVLLISVVLSPDFSITGYAVTNETESNSVQIGPRYISPTSDGSYKSPTSDNSYKSPTVGEGYIAPKIDESWEPPKEGPGFQKPEVGPGLQRPEVGPGFEKPEIGPGFQDPLIGPGFERIGTWNVSFDESGEKIVQKVLELSKIDISQGNESLIKNDPKRPKVEPKGPIDKASVGGWKVYGITHYYKSGGSKFIPATIAQMNLHDDGTYDYGGKEGTWEATTITEDDWKKWGIKNENFNKKLIFHNWPDGVDGIADGPIEDTSYGARYLWAVFNTEPPESAEPAQAWVRFVAAPYKPKTPIEEESFSELSLIGRWGIHFIPIRKNEKGQWVRRFETTTILELKADKTWTFGTSQGAWKVLPIEEEDWAKWTIEPYGPKKKIVLEGFGDEGGSGPIEAYKGEVSFFWLVYKTTNPETGKQAWLQRKFRSYENPVTYLTAEGEGLGKITSEDGKLNCAVEEAAAQGSRGRRYVSDAGASGDIQQNDEQETAQGIRGRRFREDAGAFGGSDKTDLSNGPIPQGCVAEYEVNKEVEIKAIPEKGWLFLRWGGACESDQEAAQGTRGRRFRPDAGAFGGTINDEAAQGRGNNEEPSDENKQLNDIPSETEAVCKITMDRSKTVTAEFVPGCNDDSECSSDQKCENSRCAPVECECGYAQNHQCQKYECCSKADCGEMACDTSTHKCVSESACREFSIMGDSAVKHDIVFVGDGFDDYKIFKQLLVYIVDYEGKYNGFFSVSPFKESKDKFNFWMVLAPDYKYRENGNPLNEDIERFVSTCERDTVVIISRNTYRPYAFFPISGSKGGRAYVSLGFAGVRGTDFAAENSGRLLLHEFGHAFGGLTDEYVEYGRGTRKDIDLAPNCAVDLETAKGKWGDLIGVEEVDFYTGIPDVPGTKYFKNNYVSVPEIGLEPDGSDMGDGGCAYDLKNIRPTTSSLMKNQFEIGYDYGPVNERELQRRLEEYSEQAAQGTRGRRYVSDAG